MSQPSDRRDSRRLFVGPEHTVAFEVKGHAFRDIRITNISMGGCFAVVGGHSASLFSAGTILEHFALEHPEFPKSTFAAQVRYVVGSPGAESSPDFLGLGVAFMTVPDDVKVAISAYLDQLLGPE